MDKKNFFRIAGNAMATMLLAAAMMAGFSACSDDDLPPSDLEEETETYVEPTTDQLEVKVTADIPTAVLGQFDENSVGGALVKRLSQTTSAIDDNTKLVLIDFNHIESLTEDDFNPMALAYLNGGYIALQRPTLGVAFAVALGLMGKAGEIQDEMLKENGVEIPEEAASTRSSLEDSEMVRKINNARALTRSADDDENPVVAELMIIALNASYLIPPYNEEETVSSQVEDENGQELEPVEHKVKNILNPYHYGMLADGAASWLNTKEQEKVAAQQSAATKALTRADADQVINAMLSRTDEFTISGSLYAWDDKGRKYSRANASNTTIRSWSVHDFGSNRDFYYVEEQHHIRVGGENSDKGKTLYWGPYSKEDWLYSVGGDPNIGIMQYNTFSIEGWENKGNNYSFYYGSWLDESSHTMNLTGAGEIKVEKSLPGTDNNSVTESIAIGRTDVTSHTSGWSFGGSLGGNAGNVGFNWGYSESTTTSHSTSFTMTTAQVSKDLAIKRNTHGTEVTWTYQAGHTPTVIWDNFWHEMAAPILTNDIDIENKVCWSVKNPSGSYELSWYRKDYTMAQFVKSNRNSGQRFSRGCVYDDTYTLTAPRRFKKEWSSDVRVYGEDLQKGALKDFIADLQEIINPTMFSNKFYVAEEADDGVEVIKYNVGEVAKMVNEDEDLRDMLDYRASLLGIDKFTVKWFPKDKALKAKLKDNPITFTYEVSK